jgi:hypothetical protein
VLRPQWPPLQSRLLTKLARVRVLLGNPDECAANARATGVNNPDRERRPYEWPQCGDQSRHRRQIPPPAIGDANERFGSRSSLSSLVPAMTLPPSTRLRPPPRRRRHHTTWDQPRLGIQPEMRQPCVQHALCHDQDGASLLHDDVEGASRSRLHHNTPEESSGARQGAHRDREVVGDGGMSRDMLVFSPKEWRKAPCRTLRLSVRSLTVRCLPEGLQARSGRCCSRNGP